MESTLAQIFRNRAELYGDAVRWRQKQRGEWVSATWRENKALVNRLIAGLDALGVRPGEVVGILSNTRWEWMAADWAIIGVGAVSVTFYPTQVPANYAFIVRDSDARYLFVEDRKQFEKLMSIREEIPGVRKFILLEDAERFSDDPRVMSFEALSRLSERTPAEADAFAAERAAAMCPKDRAAIIYTSGTTGQPKGAVHTHATLIAEIVGCTTMLSTVHAGMTDFLFLPLAHGFGRSQHLAGYERGLTTTVEPSLIHLAQDLREAEPNLFFSVPRVYEQAYATILRRAASGSPMRQRLFEWAVDVGRQVARLRHDHRSLSPTTRLRYAVADRLVLRKIREAFGGQLYFAITGGGPLAREIQEFFQGAGVLLLDAWGLTETVSGLTLNTPDCYRIGTVGRIYPDHEIRIASDGEVLVRGPCVFAGYHNNPRETAEVLDADGWLHTGDIGTLDADGFLRVIDRKKDLIITAGGENIAPQLVENAFKGIPCISQVCVYGDRKPHLVALLTLNPAEVRSWAQEHSMTHTDVGEIARSRQFRDFLSERVALANRRLATNEVVRSYDVLAEDFTLENNLLTPTLKIRRQSIHERYREQFEALYERVKSRA